MTWGGGSAPATAASTRSGPSRLTSTATSSGESKLTRAAEWMTVGHEVNSALPSSSSPRPSVVTSPATTWTRRWISASKSESHLLAEAAESVVAEQLPLGPLGGARAAAGSDEQDQLAVGHRPQQTLHQGGAEEPGGTGDGNAPAGQGFADHVPSLAERIRHVRIGGLDPAASPQVTASGARLGAMECRADDWVCHALDQDGPRRLRRGDGAMVPAGTTQDRPDRAGSGRRRPVGRTAGATHRRRAARPQPAAGADARDPRNGRRRWRAWHRAASRSPSGRSRC